MSNTSEEQLYILIRAAFPAVCVVSHEEERVEKAIVDIIDRKNKKFSMQTQVWRWSLTEAMVPLDGNRAPEDRESPLDALNFIKECQASAVFILRDFMQFLNGPNAYRVERTMRDVIRSISRNGKGTTIVLLDTKLEIPDRLEKEISVVDWDLPTRSQLTEDLRPLIMDYKHLAKLGEEKITEVLNTGIDCALGLTRTEVENTFAKSLAMTKTLDPKIIVDEKKAIVRKSGVLEFYETDFDLSSVGGLSVLKDWLKCRGRAFSQEAREYGLPHPKGMLIVGIPGTGKSLISKAIGAEWNMPVLKMDVGALFGSLVGQSEANMRKALKTAEAMAPCVLWIDEIEKSVGGGSSVMDGGTTSRVFGTILSWMQDKKAPVFVTATANNVAALPPEMLRKGRFDEMFFVDLPSPVNRKEIFELHINKRNRAAEGFDLNRLVDESQDFSGAEIEQAIVSAMYHAFNEDREFTTSDIQSALNNTVCLATTMRERITDLREWAKSRAVLADVPVSQEIAVKASEPGNRQILAS